MFRLRLSTEDAYLILAPRWADLEPAWQVGLLAALLAVPLLLVLCLYRYELRLVSWPAALGTLALRLLILLVLVGAIGLQPFVVKESVEEAPGRVRVAIDLSSSMEVADHQRTAEERAGLVRILGTSDVDTLTRKEIVARLLQRSGLNLLNRLAERHQLEIVGFHENRLDLSAEQVDAVLQEKNRVTRDTNLLRALSVKGIKDRELLRGNVLFSDGQHSVDVAVDALGSGLSAPIYPVVIGSREPPRDLMIAEVKTDTKAFKDTIVDVHVLCRAHNLPAQEMTVEIQIDDEPILPEHRHLLNHQGQQDYPLKFEAKMNKVGTRRITVAAQSTQGKEITLANNVATRFICVIEEKAKVLLVDGEARWEYQYLANALLRDGKIALERVVFGQPRIGAIKEADLDKAGLPKLKLPAYKMGGKGPDPLLEYACIMLGDVSPADLPTTDRQRLLSYVAERGGTLIVSAGKRYMPLTYTKAPGADADPLVKLLPITNVTELRPESGFFVKPTSAGKSAPFLDLSGAAADDVWSELPKHFWGVVGKRKPAATVLLTPGSDAGVPKDSDTGIMVQQDYGLGRVVFVGLDSTWRWRFRVGDKHHHRFWGQLARSAAAEELLPAGNRWVRYGARESIHTEGAEAELAVRLSASLPPLLDDRSVKMKLYRRHDDKTQTLIGSVALTRNARQPFRFEGKAPPLPPGVYRVEPDIPQYREQLAEPSENASEEDDTFRILARQPRELLDLSTNWTLMQSLAQRSDGRLLTPDTVEELLDRLERRIERKVQRIESRPWQDEPMVWWMLGILLGLLTLEWGWRKWLDLA